MSSDKAEHSIAFAGIPGANADLVCRVHYPYLDPVAVPEFEDVFEAVERGDVKYGLIPIENSQAGRVAEIHSLLPGTRLHIIAEHWHRIEHQLFGIKGAELKDLHEVYSHTQALMQSRKQIRKLGLEARMHPDTAMAGRDVAEWADKSKGAICSELAGKLYGLDLLKRNVEDDETNHTLFVTISREPVDVAPETEYVLTSLIFTARSIPASLYKCLSGFATNGVNIIKLESYLVKSLRGAAQFFITFEGNPSEKRVQLALEELGFFSQKTQILGVYPADIKRYQ
ncbi:MAG: prephenate dehydratase [Rickettsiales bacterium]|nr:prephenate dehydratase [Rickettsiales bacterium]|tara:strand:+ start:462 stop:1313 length:852 start_codon:yes stop_codon:yes gene_type:complete